MSAKAASRKRTKRTPLLAGDDPKTKAKRLFIQKKLKPGERVHFMYLTGQAMDTNRAAIVRTMYKKMKALKKRPWDLFRLTIRPEPENEHDPDAVAVDIWWKNSKSKEWKQHQLGFLKRKDKGEEVGHNKTIGGYLKAQQVKKIKYKTSDDGAIVCFKVYAIRVYANLQSGESKPSVLLGIVTSADAHAPAPGCVKLESYYRNPETGKIGRGALKIKSPEIKAQKPKHEGATAPVVESHDYPTKKQLGELLTLIKTHAEWFFHEETVDGVHGKGFPVSIHQWRGNLKKLKNDEKIQQHVERKTLGEIYEDFNSIVDLEEVQKDFGPTMAENFYFITGGFAGPMTKVNAQDIIVTMRKIVAALKEHKRGPSA